MAFLQRLSDQLKSKEGAVLRLRSCGKAEAGFSSYAIQGDSSRAVVRVKLPLLEELESCPEKALKGRTRSRS
jgi:hypothetical protein